MTIYIAAMNNHDGFFFIHASYIYLTNFFISWKIMNNRRALIGYVRR